VNVGIPQQAAVQVPVGRSLRVTTENLAGQVFSGRVTAIDSVVDETTRNVQVQATLSNPEGKLKPGMFVQVEIGLGTSREVIELPASAISYAPYGDSVFIITDLKDQKGQTYRGVRQQFVKVEGSRGDQVGVVSGVNPGDEVVSSGVFKLRNGAAVQVNNKVQPGNSPAPKPEDS
jgi:membrane fusion protein (multidrug efflux system)